VQDDERGGGDDLLADVNAHAFDLAQRLGSMTDDEELWGFRCECGSPDCQSRVLLSLAEYARLRGQGEPVLEHDHSRKRPTGP
jgi:hypothetical protein